ncbi:MAG: hypothetical protein M1834_005530 [Cirrosporium novae-zelandiae]|nr:MAG: hypothetical protein M1834_005530 [Cirrosporium novae-zelandiae]
MPPKARGEYIETDTGNKVSRRSQIHGTQHIILGGRTVIQADVCIRGDLCRAPSHHTSSNPNSTASNVSVAIGRYTFLSRGCTLRPPSKTHRGVFSYFPLKIGDHTFVGKEAIIEAASIGSNVHIGAGAIIQKFCIIKDFVKVLEGTVVPAGMVVPSFSIVGGSPGRVIGEVGDGFGVGDGMVEGGDLRELWRMTG